MMKTKYVCNGPISPHANLTLFPPPPPPPPPLTSHELQYISVTTGFTRLSMKTKYVCRGLISLHVNFHNNRTMWSTNLHLKKLQVGGGKEKEPPIFLQSDNVNGKNTSNTSQVVGFSSRYKHHLDESLQVKKRSFSYTTPQNFSYRPPPPPCFHNFNFLSCSTNYYG